MKLKYDTIFGLILALCFSAYYFSLLDDYEVNPTELRNLASETSPFPEPKQKLSGLLMIERNSLLSFHNPSEVKPQGLPNPKGIWKRNFQIRFQTKHSKLSARFENAQDRKIKMVITAYSSTVCQTDNTPYITASGARVRKGIVANNKLAFGTKIQIPEIYGDKIFTVKDRMHPRKGPYHIDIWFPSKQEAIDFGVKIAYIKVLEI